MNLTQHLALRAAKHPGRKALIDAKGGMTFSELHLQVCKGSQKFRKDGLVPGDRVLIFQPVGIPLYISILAALHAGLTVILIDPGAGCSALRSSLSLSPPRAFIGIGKAHLLRITIPEIRRIPLRYHTDKWAPFSRKWNLSFFPKTSENLPAPIPRKDEAPALITFTSGSTGKPKAACRSHGFLLAQHEALSTSLDHSEGEADLVTLPVFTLSNLASGVTSVLADTDLGHPARANSTAVATQCRDHNVTRCAASPAFFKKLLQDDHLPPFRSIYTGGAPVFPRLLDELHAARPETRLIIIYGSTEAEPIAHTTWSEITLQDRRDMATGKGLLTGKPVAATRLKIIQDSTGKEIPSPSENEFRALEVPPGTIGEIIVTGAHVLKGYLGGHGDRENKIKLPDTTWHRTGDAGWLDPAGRLWLLGRCSAAIPRKNALPLYPFGIECAAMENASIERCALVLHQEKITLCIQFAKQAPATGQAELLARLHPLGVEQILPLPRIPVDHRHNAKINYPALRQSLSAKN